MRNPYFHNGTAGMRQIGCIVFGSLDARYWIDAKRRLGFFVLIRDGYAEYWK